MKKRKKKLIFLLIISLGLILLLSSIGAGKVIDFLEKFLGDIFNLGYRIGFTGLLLTYIKFGHEMLYAEMVNLLTMNPPVKENILLNAFIQLTLPFYVLAITAIGFYLILLSASPAKRARAKAMLGKLVLGMFIISLSKNIWELGLGLSKNLTYQILNLVSVDVYIEVIKDFLTSFSLLHWILNIVDPGAGWVFPSLWIWFLVWGTFGVIMLRYIAVTLWISLFPLTVFFYSFEITRSLGKNMMEQTILWILIQSFNAVVVVAVVLSFITPWTKDLFIIAHFANFMIFMGAFMIIMAPLMMLRIFRNFLPG